MSSVLDVFVGKNMEKKGADFCFRECFQPPVVYFS